VSTETVWASSQTSIAPTTESASRRALAWPRLTWWLELVTVGVGYLLYEATRLLASPHLAPAVAHGRQIMSAERWLHLDPEATLNHLLNQWDALADTAGYYYSTLHFVITPLVLIFLWRQCPQAYAWLRSALVAATVVALAVFIVWPAAPPRFTVSGLSDTLVQHHIMGMSNGHGVTGLINQYAAMPSLHVGWAVWCATAIVVTSRSPWRHLAWLYPITTTLVVLATANHYLLDAAAGAVLTLVAIAAMAPPRRRDRRTLDIASIVLPPAR
jgi:hypothetical protein